ncbi:hypothetical protein CY34DRAFT_16825 [Suillus luteus UH-Slu-Lm8-n1]|uniref:Unplaced genomic scaffold CY34scaffold_460, whole genome shotgun sequence n=1 Tax=Suillus luteus UH-Slu-Lm8-n1 TaxID=930992 RepID=A0A0D0ANA6_9AGAM|nr:hypothetical protein CY34DRAFT_16825 [Suillus luteus UH-Slu-Lm8-n1]
MSSTILGPANTFTSHQTMPTSLPTLNSQQLLFKHSLPSQIAASAVAQPDSAAQHHLEEWAALQAWLLQLDTEEANGAHPSVNTPPVPPLVLFADSVTVKQACAAAVALYVELKKISLPDLVPGFKANPLDAIIPPKVLETMPEGQIKKEGLGLSSYAVPLARLNSKGKATLVKVPNGLQEKCGKVQT